MSSNPDVRSSYRGKIYTCLFCTKKYTGGGVNQMKQHLAGQKGAIGGCSKVSYDVRYQMQKNLEEIVVKKKDIAVVAIEVESEDNDVEVVVVKKRKCPTASDVARCSKSKPASFEIATRTTLGSQPSIESAFQTKERKLFVDMKVAKWVYYACLPFYAVDNEIFQEMLNAVIAYGPGYKTPSYHDFRINLLEGMKKEVSVFVGAFRKQWEDTGCTLMADGWLDKRNRNLINFLAYSTKGVVFLKSVDVGDVIKTGENLCNLFKEVIAVIGSENVVQVVTDNAANYVAAGRLLEKEYATLFWSPCAAHCLNLMLKEIGELADVQELVKQATEITKFVYNHIYVLSLLRKRPGWTEIIRPGATRFATTFLSLQSLLAHKDDLQFVFLSKEFTTSNYYTEKRKMVKEILVRTTFWNSSRVVVRATEPLVRVLRLVDSDDRPAMGYLYEAMDKAKEAIRTLFHGKKKQYMPYWKIIDHRWNKQLRRSIHAAAYWLNPKLHYNKDTFSKHPEIQNGLFDVVEKFVGEKISLLAKINKEMKMFANQQKNFGRPMAKHALNVKLPGEWWNTFGSECPNLQRIAVRILSQTCSSSGCERNWSVFERIRTKKRNRLEHQRLNDLVFIQYNLHLQRRTKIRGINFDPIDVDAIDVTEEWTVATDDEPPPLDVDELERMVHKEARPITKTSGSRKGKEVVNVDDNVAIEDDEVVMVGGDDDDDDVGDEIEGKDEGVNANDSEDDLDWM